VNDLTGTAAHTDYVRTIAETGVIGSAALLWLYVSLFKATNAALDRARNRFERDLVTAFLAVLLARLVMAFTDNIIVQPVLEWYFWSLAALVMAIGSTADTSPSLLARRGLHVVEAPR
jgi:cell division protein FtsW (lipid II flippase)